MTGRGALCLMGASRPAGLTASGWLVMIFPDKRITMKRFNAVNHMTVVLCAMTLIGLVWTVPEAHADWSSVAAGCVPDSSTVSANLANTSAISGGVKFRGNSIGHIRLTCPVSGFRGSSSDASFLAVTYYDPDDAGTTCHVRAFLLRSNLNHLERGNTIVGFDSNTGYSRTEPSTGRKMGFVRLPEYIDFNANYYWIDLEVFRSNTSCNPTAVGAFLG